MVLGGPCGQERLEGGSRSIRGVLVNENAGRLILLRRVTARFRGGRANGAPRTTTTGGNLCRIGVDGAITPEPPEEQLLTGGLLEPDG